MATLFKKRTVQIERDTGIDLTGATLLQLRYIKPDGLSKGYWPALQDGATSVIYYKTTTTDIDQAGDWKIQSYVEIGGEKYSGAYTTERFEKPIDL